MDRGEKYRFGLRKEKRLTQIQMELGWDDEDLHMAEGLLGTPFPSFRQRKADRDILTLVLL